MCFKKNVGQIKWELNIFKPVGYQMYSSVLYNYNTAISTESSIPNDFF